MRTIGCFALACVATAVGIWAWLALVSWAVTFDPELASALEGLRGGIREVLPSLWLLLAAYSIR